MPPIASATRPSRPQPIRSTKPQVRRVPQENPA
ncbi:hypothetical protein GTY75_24295 [Streptomyces sp. SID8381]|nr:hypothetical protein [Streptomyces sp. SID8381]